MTFAGDVTCIDGYRFESGRNEYGGNPTDEILNRPAVEIPTVIGEYIHTWRYVHRHMETVSLAQCRSIGQSLGPTQSICTHCCFCPAKHSQLHLASTTSTIAPFLLLWSFNTEVIFPLYHSIFLARSWVLVGMNDADITCRHLNANSVFGCKYCLLLYDSGNLETSIHGAWEDLPLNVTGYCSHDADIEAEGGKFRKESLWSGGGRQPTCFYRWSRWLSTWSCAV
jgi:hypothetical protein